MENLKGIQIEPRYESHVAFPTYRTVHSDVSGDDNQHGYQVHEEENNHVETESFGRSILPFDAARSSCALNMINPPLVTNTQQRGFNFEIIGRPANEWHDCQSRHQGVDTADAFICSFDVEDR